MPTIERLVATAILLIAATTQPAGCRRERSITPEPKPSARAPSPTPSTQPHIPLPEVFSLPQDEDAPIREGWARIIEKDDAKVRAWIEGSVIRGDKLVITTHKVRCFRLDFSRMRVDWSGKVLLRLDGFNSELTRKRYPRITFVRTPTGAWDVRDD